MAWIKYYVGKDRTKEAPRRARSQGPLVCRNCGDSLNSEGFCVRCSAVLAHYREVDGDKFVRFQRSRRRAL